LPSDEEIVYEEVEEEDALEEEQGKGEGDDLNPEEIQHAVIKDSDGK
jgi:hypothetical protein